MPATRLTQHRVEKPWGRRTLWPGFADPAPGGEPVGEIWFQGAGDAALLVKYLFTSERLSIQVHPDDAAAHASGHAQGKDEAWVILAAEPDSTIALGLKQATTRERLREAALDGGIEALMDWRPVKAGDVIYSPAGTVHAIGAGITLIEVQQNIDLTYRLYDYGRPRELHLDAGIAVSDPVSFAPVTEPQPIDAQRTMLADGPKFALERWSGPLRQSAGAGWFVPVAGAGAIDGEAWRAGECWLVEGGADITLADQADALFAYLPT